jgi:hypothetical protein
LDISEPMIRYYLDSVTTGYFNNNEVPPDSVEGYLDQVRAMQRKAADHGDLDTLKMAFEYLLRHPEIDAGHLGDDRYPYSDEEIREIIRYARHIIWPETSTAELSEPPNVRLVQMPLEDWWKARGRNPKD